MLHRAQDAFNYLSKLSLTKVRNAFSVWFSFHFSKWSGRTIHPGRPLSISVEPTTACNLGCPECPSGLKIFTRPTGNIREMEFRKWVDQLAPTLTYINFYFQGEPFIHPAFLSMVSYASKMGIYTSTSTNAHFITDDVAEQTIDSGLDRLIISIDGTTQEVYSSYRVNGSLEKVLQGTRAIMEAKKRKKSRTPYVIFQFLVVKPNEHQVDEVKKLARSFGVNEVKFKTAQVYDFENGNSLIPDNPAYSRYKKLSSGKYVIKNKLDNHCWRMWSSCVITWNGFVVPCCFDKDAVHRLGDLRNYSFSEIWNNTEYRQFREQLFRSRKEIDICANCSEGTRVWA